LFGGAELPALWAALFLAALADSALRFLSLARIEDELTDHTARERFGRYVENLRGVSALCVIVRVASATCLVALVVARGLGQSGRVGPAVAAAGGLVLAAEAAARLVGRKWSAGVLVGFLPVLYWLSWPLRPLDGVAQRGTAPDSEEPEPEVVEAAKEEIRVAIEDGTVEGALEAEEKEMIEGIMKFGDVDVAEVMTPRTDMECLPVDLPLEQAIQRLGDFRHSRVPVYDGSLDDIVGILYVKDLLGTFAAEAGKEPGLRDVVREPLFVPETKTLDALLQQFQTEHVQIGIVLDEYGGVVGLVTVEDIMEEIVGEIQDEYDEEDHENRIVRHSPSAVDVDARLRIDEVNELLDVDVPQDQDYDTIGGYVTAMLAHVPSEGEEFTSDGLLVRVLESDERRVRRVCLTRVAPEGQ
jgi:CBS domain containing-hemolysin-like protein